MLNLETKLSTAIFARSSLNTDFRSYNRTIYQHFGAKIKNHSEITLPIRKNAIQLNSGRFRAILRHSFSLIVFTQPMYISVNIQSRFSVSSAISQSKKSRDNLDSIMLCYSRLYSTVLNDNILPIVAKQINNISTIPITAYKIVRCPK